MLFGILACGCLSPASNHASNPSAQQTGGSGALRPSELPPEVSASKVTYSVYGPPPKYSLYYEVYSARVSANFGTNQLESGVTGNVSGTIYTQGPCTFTALSARGSKSSPKSQVLDILTLTGDVAIHCQKPAGDLFCDRLTMNMTTHLVQALGHVRFKTASGLQGTMPEAWATQDLTRIASPQLFREGIPR